ncbi:hypothetical protein [Paenibacillus sp. MMS18-CY102]|uniref:hypothetical protein n=1 Tax=Paenibacillus sp. MMS18-CY102 TaxID=2682849 RepID=UPI0013667E48|nr:hypothetical protein [Paenibacillus sp. MMS18-CY102]MWC29592.1 hypothetical protein [Paenibacillus sp. MMS18-CY102]
MNKKLYTSKPVVSAFPIFANVLSIITKHKDAQNWIFSNFIHVSSSPKLYSLTFYDCWNYVRNCPLLIHNTVDRWIIEEKWKNDINAFLIDAINHESYAYFYLDEAKLKNTSVSQMVESFTHDVMVFGYDLQEKTFNIAGNLINGKYVESTCTFDEMELAFAHANLSNDWFHGIKLLRVNENEQYRIHKPTIKQAFSDYCNSVNIAQARGNLNLVDEVFGLEVYDILIEYIEKSCKENSFELNFMPFYFMWEHKDCLLARFDYLIQEGILQQNETSDHIRNELSHLVQRALILRNSIYKYALLNDQSKLLQGIKRLEEMRSIEQEVIPMLCELL